MKKQLPIILGIIVVLAGVTGFVIYKTVFSPKPVPAPTEVVTNETLPQADASISVSLGKSPTAANTLVLSVSGMANKLKSLSYELTFDSNGVTQGVTGKDVDVTSKDAFSRTIYLGTCSKNDCRPYPGVTKVSLTLVFTDLEGKQSQFTKDYPL